MLSNNRKLVCRHPCQKNGTLHFGSLVACGGLQTKTQKGGAYGAAGGAAAGAIIGQVIGRNTESTLWGAGICRGVVDRVIGDGKPIAVSDAETEEDDIADTLKILKIESVVCMPLMSCPGVTGAIYIDSLERPYCLTSTIFSLSIASVANVTVNRTRVNGINVQFHFLCVS